MKRRDFLGVCAAPLFVSRGHAAAPFPVKFKQEPPYASVLAFAEPGTDEFPGEKPAMELEMRLGSALAAGDLPFATACTGATPAPVAYRKIAADVAVAVFDGSGNPADGWAKWRASLGTVRRGVFYSLPGGMVRYDIRSSNAGRLEHRVGIWKLIWNDGAVTHLEPVEETVTSGAQPWFRDITGAAFAGVDSFQEQLAKGVPYWRARLDSACGIDVYGENGIAVGDIDNDGLDEIYVCQPGGLPNRLYKNDGNGHFHDISHEFGLDILDNTTSALFVDLRNSGHQDLVLVRPSQPTLFLNEGKGKFTSDRRRVPFSNASARYVHQRIRRRLRSRRPARSVCLHVHLFSERGPVQISDSLSRRAQRAAELSVPQLPGPRPALFRRRHRGHRDGRKQ